MSTFDATGLTLDSLNEIKEALIADFKTAFGDNFKESDDSVSGQIASIIAEVVNDLGEKVQKAVDAFDPDAATGVSHAKLVLLNGITKNESEYSTVVLSCTANSAGSTIPVGSLVSDPSNPSIKFATDSELILAPSVTDTVSATCTEKGAYEAAAGTLTNIDNPVFGWDSVTNASEANIGHDEETDTELRLRRRFASEQNGFCSIPAIHKALADIDDVDDVVIYENYSGVTTSEGLPTGHIWVVIDGGSNASIAEIIFTHIAAGIGTFGTTTVNHSDSVTGKTYPINFSRPSEQSIYIDMVITTDADFPSDGEDRIKQNIVDFFAGELQKADDTYYKGFSSGDNIIFTKMYTPINAVPGVTIEELYIGFSPSPTGTSDLYIAKNSKGVTDSTKITIS